MKKNPTWRNFFGPLAGLFCCLFFVHITGAAAPRSVRSLLEIRQHQVVMQQFDLSCGAAALATLLRYHFDDAVTERQIATALIRRDDYLTDPDRLRQQQGFSLLDLKHYVQQRGYEARGLRGMTQADLIELAPLMVPVDLYGTQHFVVVRGVIDGQVLLADPAWGNRSLPINRFMQAWINDPGVGGIGFVVKRRRWPAPANHLPTQAAGTVQSR